MELELRLFATVREAVGARAKKCEFNSDATVRDVLSAMETEHPELAGRLLDENGDISRSITVLRDGTNVTHFEGAATELADGDSLSITPPITGG